MLERSAEAPLLWEQCDTEEAFRQQILENEPDVVLLQELPGIVPFVETHDMVKENPKSHSGHLATLVSHDLMEGSVTHSSVPGCGLLTTFENLGITIANVHLHPGKGKDKARREQLSDVIQSSPLERIAIIGDTNSRASEARRIQDVGLLAPNPPRHTWDSFKNRFHLGGPRFRANFTRCFIHPDIEVLNLKVIDTPLKRESKQFFISDHFALCGTLGIPTPSNYHHKL